MREGKKFKKLLIGVAAAAMTMLCTLPVSAATKSFKPITVKAIFSQMRLRITVTAFSRRVPAPDMILYMHMAEKQKL